MSRILNNIDSTKQKVIFAGDFNINLLEINENHNYSDFFDLLFTNNLLPQITLPTRFSVHNGTLIDNLFTNIQFTANSSKAGILLDKLYWNVPCGDTSCRTLIDVCVCVCLSVRRHIAKLRQE